jgi:hypothetical protein
VSSIAGRLSASPEYFQYRLWIDPGTIDAHGPVEMRTCHSACGSDFANFLAARDRVAFLHIDNGQVGQQ